MIAVLTGEDLVVDALRKSGETIDGTSPYENDALLYMNTFYLAILSGGNEFQVGLAEPWSWAKAKYPGVLILQPPYSSGTVSLTSSSTTGAFSVAPTSSQAGKYLKITDRPEYFRIATHVANTTAFTIDAPYSDLSGTFSYMAIQLDYDLDAASLLRPIGAMKVHRSQTEEGNNEGKIEGMEEDSFARTNPIHRLVAGTPTQFTIYYSSNGTYSVRFNMYVSTQTRVEYDYIPIPAEITRSASSIPVIPAAFRQVLSYATAHAICQDKEDDKTTTFFQLVAQKLQAMVNANRKDVSKTSNRFGRMYPRADARTSTRILRSGDN